MSSRIETWKSWDRQPGETVRAYAAFLVYRDLGPFRSLRKATVKFYGEDTGKTASKQRQNSGKISTKLRQCQRWSAAHRWVARVEAWDREEERQRVIEHRERIKKMDERQAKYGEVLQQFAYKNILVNEGVTEGTRTLTPDESRRLMETGAKIERLALGTATEFSRHEITQAPIRVVKFVKQGEREEEEDDEGEDEDES